MPEISPRRQLPRSVISDEEKKRALYQEVCQSSVLNMTPAWYLSDSRYEVRDGNSLKVYCSGEDVFGDIADSILNAKKSADIVCTFFDPAMLMTRRHTDYSKRDGAHSAWHVDDSLGGIIINALKKNPELKIRLVIWLHLTGQAFGNNIIGIDRLPQETNIPHAEGATGFDIRDIPDPGKNKEYPQWREINRKYASLHLRSRTKEAADYSRQWFQRVTWEVDDPNTGRHQHFDRLCITRRAITTPRDILNEDQRLGGEFATLDVGCDHQKTVLIDLDDSMNSDGKPHGYVLGHNYFTQYWSKFPFVHRDPAHEMDYLPYHDFSMQIKGPLLIDLNANFCEAYGARVVPGVELQRLGILTEGRVAHPLLTPLRGLPTKEPGAHYTFGQKNGPQGSHSYSKVERTLHAESPDALYNARLALEEHLLKEKGSASGQVVRTRPDQPLHRAHEKEIKDAYLQVVRHASNYLLLVNQYFQYNRLARQIKYWKNEANQAFKKSCANEETRTLYLFLGTCKAENHGMIFRTQQMANEFGAGDQLGKAFDEMYDKDSANPENGRRELNYRTVEEDGEEFQVPNINNVNPMPHIVKEDMDALGIKVLFFMFYAPLKSQGAHPIAADQIAQQVYVHSKLMIEDDAFFTLGSANTNIRSFAVDSELNIISDDKETATETRHKLLSGYAGIYEPTAKFPNKPGILGQAELKPIYEEMQDIAQDNSSQIKKRQQIQGLIALYDDDRTVDVIRKA